MPSNCPAMLAVLAWQYQHSELDGVYQEKITTHQPPSGILMMLLLRNRPSRGTAGCKWKPSQCECTGGGYQADIVGLAAVKAAKQAHTMHL